MLTNKLQITFEAHYWGTFQLTALPNEWDVYGQIPYPIGRSLSHGPQVSLMYDPPSGYLFLSNQSERPIALSTEAFFDLDQINAWSPGESLHFDRRKKLEEILTPEEFIITAINDPEHFEDVSAYLELIHKFEELSHKDLSFSHKSGKELAGHQKEIHLKEEGNSWIIQVEKELFDNQVIFSLNEMLKEKGIIAYSFATTINPEMYMVLLKLSTEKYEMLERMGLLV